MTRSLAALLLICLTAAPAAAQEAAPSCPADAAPIPAELAGWASKAPLTAAADNAGLPAASVEPGKAVELTLHPTPHLGYAATPERPGTPDSNGGMVRFTVTAAGTYRVALGSAAWIDLVQGGATIPSVAHGHGPACSGIRKIVDFTLAPGDYVVQIVGNKEPSTALLVARRP